MMCHRKCIFHQLRCKDVGVLHYHKHTCQNNALYVVLKIIAKCQYYKTMQIVHT